MAVDGGGRRIGSMEQAEHKEVLSKRVPPQIIIDEYRDAYGIEPSPEVIEKLSKAISARILELKSGGYKELDSDALDRYALEAALDGVIRRPAKREKDRVRQAVERRFQADSSRADEYLPEIAEDIGLDPSNEWVIAHKLGGFSGKALSMHELTARLPDSETDVSIRFVGDVDGEAMVSSVAQMEGTTATTDWEYNPEAKKITGARVELTKGEQRITLQLDQDGVVLSANWENGSYSYDMDGKGYDEMSEVLSTVLGVDLPRNWRVDMGETLSATLANSEGVLLSVKEHVYEPNGSLYEKSLELRHVLEQIMRGDSDTRAFLWNNRRPRAEFLLGILHRVYGYEQDSLEDIPDALVEQLSKDLNGTTHILLRAYEDTTGVSEVETLAQALELYRKLDLHNQESKEE